MNGIPVFNLVFIKLDVYNLLSFIHVHLHVHTCILLDFYFL